MGVGRKRCIRAVTLDLDDTLWPCEPTLVRAERIALEFLTERAPQVMASWTADRLRERRMAIHAARPDLKHDFVTIRKLALHGVFREAGADDAQAAPVIDEAVDRYMRARHEVELYPEVRACLERLSENYRLGSLSNGNACLVTIGLDHLFHARVAAHTHGVSKPDAAVFQLACRELGCEPAETVHVGDDIELDVRGARAAGLNAVWLNRTEQVWPGDDPPAMVKDLEAFERWLEQA